MRLKAASPLSGAATNTNCEPSGRLTIVRIATQVRIRVSDEGVWCRPSRVYESHVNGALEISEDPFCCVPVFYSRILNEVAEDPDNIGDIRPGSNGKVKQFTNQFAIWVIPHLQLPFWCVR